MTELQFYFYIVYDILYEVTSACGRWLKLIFTNTGSTRFYLSCISLFFITRFLIRPLVGEAIGSGASDIVKAGKSGANKKNGKSEKKEGN